MTTTNRLNLLRQTHLQLPILYPNFTPVTSLGVSIVVPTFKRVGMCETLLASLAISQQKLETPVEIIFVDNSPPKEAQQIQSLCHEYKVQYYHKLIGVGAKRNFGAKVATYPIILFIDSDCEATPDLIAQHLNYYSQNPETVAVLGRTKFKGKKNFVWRTIQYSPFIVPFTLANQPGQQVWGPSNNLSCRKAIFEKVGGFDENFPTKPGGEDVDLGYRFYKKGYLFTTNPQAVVYHTTETWNTFGQVVKRLFNWGQAEFYLYYNHGEYLYYDCPKGLGLCLLFAVIGLAMFVLERHPKWLLLSIVFFGINFISRLILHLCYHPERISKVTKVVFSEIFVLVYEFGLTLQCVKKVWFLPLFHRLVVIPDQVALIWNQQVLYMWVTFAQLILAVAIVYSL